MMTYLVCRHTYILEISFCLQILKMSSNDQRAKRMASKRIKQHITSCVLDVIPVKRTNHEELDKLCLTDSKISEI